MSKARLLARLAKFHKADPLAKRKPSSSEREVLDKALAEFEQNPDPGEPWRDVFRQIRESHR